ncbi:MAG: SapC family protein [Pantoea sp.]|uniref:SapC family protein n=1 Tax=Pantoea sp. TaxID=69393 RepID=UPI0039E33591
MSNSGNTLLLYKKIDVLSREAHKNLHLRPAADLGFAADTHFVPLAGNEFFLAARYYPILFVGEGEHLAPIALLGLQPGQNLLVDGNGQWERNSYIPAFVRRYPFVPAPQDEGFTICFDSACKDWNDSEGNALFDADGNNTPFLEETIRFLGSFTAEVERTNAFVAKLKELELLVDRTLQLRNANGESFALRDFKTVDEARFAQLEDVQVLELHRAGFLGWIYAHLMSLSNANRLFERHLAAKAGTH